MRSETHSAASYPKTEIRKFLNLPAIHIILIVIIGIACYSNTFHVPMLLDDESSIQLHDPVHGLAKYFSEGWPGYNFLPNRAFGYLTFALNYEFGELNVTGYHQVNLAIHLAASLLVYGLVLQTFRTPLMSRAAAPRNEGRVFALVVALFFVCHPIQTQAVTYIVQRLTSMAAMFYLAAIACYQNWRLSLQGQATRSRQQVGWYLLALLSTILAMKTKEISITLPIMLLVYECSFFGLPGRKLLAKMSPLLMTVLLIPATRIIHVVPTLTSSAGTGAFISDNAVTAASFERFTRWEYLYTQFSVIVTYLRLLLFPVNQKLDYDYQLNHSLFAFKALFSLLLLLTIFMLAVYMYVKSRPSNAHTFQGETAADCLPFFSRPMLRLAAFGIFWFFITLSVESSIIKIQDVINEHRLYLPSFGFFLTVTALATLALTRLKENFRWLPKVAAVITGCIILALSVATYARNHVWRDWISLWSDNVAKTPNKPRPHNILGIGYYYRMEYDKALVQLREAVRIKPDYVEPYFNMGLVYKGKKDHEKAVIMFAKVIKLSADPFPKAYNEIGISYAELGYPDQALEAFASAVKYEPESVEYRNNYAFALSTAGNVKEARRQYEATLKLDPENSYALQALQELNISDNGKSGR